MFCAKCGAPNDDNAFKCTSCGAVLQRATPPMDQSGLGPAKSYLAQSIIVTVLCCMPAGVPAIVYSAMTMSKNGEGDYETAQKYSKNAMMWAWISFGIGFVVGIGWALLSAMGALAGGAAGRHP
jgi:hypothetical protein